MGNYDFGLDLYTDNANADIIKRIEKNSTILEFGPAYGRMTKYLNKQLSCTVDIVEIDEESGSVAAQYARKACIGLEAGDINKNNWKRELLGNKYDVIIFTDVLEHLQNPEETLKECLDLLNNNGKILCSIPNIAHASVILSLLSGKFEYTLTGLLDKTHTHFFTNDTFLDMVSKAGYFASYVHAIVVPVGANEIHYDYSTVNKDIETILRSRPNNEAYQYIYELRKEMPGSEHECITSMQPKQVLKSSCYILEDNDSSYNEEKKMTNIIPTDCVDIVYSLNEFPNTKAIRIQLMGCNGLINLHTIVAESDEETVEITQYDTSAIRVSENMLCSKDEPIEVYFWLTSGIHWKAIRISYDILIYNSDVLKIIIGQMGKEIEKITQYKKDKIKLEDGLREKDRNVGELLLRTKELENNLNAEQIVNKEIEEKNKNLETKVEELRNFVEDLEGKKLYLETQLQKNNEEYERDRDSRAAAFESEKLRLCQQITDINRHLSDIEEDRVRLYHIIENLNAHIQNTESSLSWKLALPMRFLGKIMGKILNVGSKIKKFCSNTIFFYKNYGMKASVYRALHYKEIKATEARELEQVNEQAKSEGIWEKLSQWIDNTPHQFIDIFPVPMGWNTPLFQRFQHLSLQAGNAGGISFYGAHPAVDDVEVYECITDTLCIVNLENAEVTNKFWELLDRKSGLKFLRIQSIDLATSIEKVQDFIQRGYQIVYEYIDEITPQITGNIPDFVLKRHEYLLQNEDITVVATSDKLFSQVKPYRNKNMVMLNNGVDYDHWNIDKEKIECPEDLREIVKQNKIIIGYHGALAQWIDYELLKRIASDNRFILLLIGFEHDGNLKKSGILDYKNVYYLGAKNYQQLNSYCAFYDVAILPFLINNITLSVSPVKIFEYMAAGKPVVTYALPECLKYKSCLCAETQDEFLQQIDKALLLRNDHSYCEQLRHDALDNTWKSITEKMIKYVMQEYEEKCKIMEERRVINLEMDRNTEDSYVQDILVSPKYKEKEYTEITHCPYVRQDKDCKIIAYYLTQFHPDAHNEKWWGKGTTEWNNVCRAVPQFVGHYQPRLPGELGFYDLRIIDNMKRQIELANMYGVYGFSFYYYWFNGERLLEKPLEMFLEHRELDFPFSLCWANENWTKRFDGTNQDILMEQPKDFKSYCNVITDIERFLKDSRYIEINGAKMLTVYRPSLMPDAKKILEYWRADCRKKGLGELYLIAVKENMIDIDWLREGFDAVSEFHPGTLYTNCHNITNSIKCMRKDFAGEIFSYPDIVLNKKYFKYDTPKLYRAVMPMWDNTARRDNKGMIFHGATPKLYKQWLKDVIIAGEQRKDLDENIIFINAWNEWGEGAYLEPDKRYGYAFLEATKEAVEETRVDN